MTEFNAPLSVEEVTPAPVGPRQALVRIAASGLCHSDLLFWQGYAPVEPPIVLGHEGAGVVEEVGSEVRSVAPGDRVVCSWMTACGACWFCVRGESRLCEELADQRGERRVARGDGSAAVPMLGVGSFADHAVLDERALVKVQTDLPDEQLALIGCGVTTGVGAVLNTAAVCPGSSVAVLGCGGVGQSVVQGARIAGATRIVAVDTAPLKRETALRLGATDAVDPRASDPVEAVRALTGRARGRLRLRGRRSGDDPHRRLCDDAARRLDGHGRHPADGGLLLDAVRCGPQREARARLLVRIGGGAP